MKVVRRHPVLVAGALILLVATGFVAWTVPGLPPVRIVLRCGFSCKPAPTGQTRMIGGSSSSKSGQDASAWDPTTW